MKRTDVPLVEAMFKRVFGNKGKRGAEIGLGSYIETVLFGSPNYSEEHGSVVYDDGAGGISSAILSVPMQFSVNGRPMMARLLCTFMSDGEKGVFAAARLSRSMRASRHDMCFSDNAAPVSADHWSAAGGVVLSVQSLEWRRSFRPLSAAALLAGRRAPLLGKRLVTAPLGVIDRLLMLWKPSMRPKPVEGVRTSVASLDTFLAHASPMTQRFAIHPVWSERDFNWLIGVVAMNGTLGDLHLRTVLDSKDRVIGAFLFLGRERETATVLNLLCEEGREFDVVNAMFSCLEGEGYAAAVGMAQPFMMNAVMRQRRLVFRHRGYFCLATRHADLKEAVERGDIYIGGLASESWSRLVTDFQ